MKKLPDICKINTHRLWRMSRVELHAISKTVSQRNQSRSKTWGLVDSMINELRVALMVEATDKPSHKWSREISQHRAKAKELEQLIWDRQVKFGCKIKLSESIARDADREGNHDLAKKVRKEHGLGGKSKLSGPRLKRCK